MDFGALCDCGVWKVLEYTRPYCSRGAQRVLRYGDMEYVMLHLIFSLPHAWGGTTCSVRCLRSLIPERILLVAHYLPVRFRQSDLGRDALFAIDVDAPSLPPAVR